MPIYEYFCVNCNSKFEALRSMTQSDAPLACPRCADTHAQRVISRVAAYSYNDGGGSSAPTGQGGGCGSCGGGHCATCRH
jgi:putative FmdB family regulatory protein